MHWLELVTGCGLESKTLNSGQVLSKESLRNVPRIFINHCLAKEASELASVNILLATPD